MNWLEALELGFCVGIGCAIGDSLYRVCKRFFKAWRGDVHADTKVPPTMPSPGPLPRKKHTDG